MSLIEININNSFNKKDDSSKTEKNFSDNSLNSTLNKNNNVVQINSAVNTTSVTNSQVDNSTFTKEKKHF